MQAALPALDVALDLYRRIYRCKRRSLTVQCTMSTRMLRNCLLWQSERNKLILIGRPPDTEIFSKRRKIYSFCVEGMSWCRDMSFHAHSQMASSKTVWKFGQYHVAGGYQQLMDNCANPAFCNAMSGHRFSAFWLRSKCSICSYQLNIWYDGHVPSSILNWFL